MTLNEAVKKVLDAAITAGYDEHQLEAIRPELVELIYKMPTTDNDDVQKLIEVFV